MKILRFANALVCVAAIYLCWLTLPAFAGWSAGYVGALVCRLVILAGIFYLCRNYSLLSLLAQGLRALGQFYCNLMSDLVCLACEADSEDIAEATKKSYPGGTIWISLAALVNLLLMAAGAIFSDIYQPIVGVLLITAWAFLSIPLLVAIVPDNAESPYPLLLLNLAAPIVSGIVLLLGFFTDTNGDAKASWINQPVTTLPIGTQWSVPLTPLALTMIGLFCLLMLFYAQACMRAHEAVLKLHQPCAESEDNSDNQLTPKDSVKVPVHEAKLPRAQLPEGQRETQLPQDPENFFGITLTIVLGDYRWKFPRARKSSRQH